MISTKINLPSQKNSIKQQNRVIQFKLIMSLVVFWSPGKNKAKTFKHSDSSLACPARACCTEVKVMGKFPSERKDHSPFFRRQPIEIFECTVVQEAKAKIPDGHRGKLCSQGNIPDFSKIQITGVTLYLNSSPDLNNIRGYTWKQTASRWQKNEFKLCSYDKWINHSFIHWFTHSKHSFY